MVLSKIQEIKNHIKSTIRSHPNGRLTLLDLRRDLKRLANIDIECFTRFYFGKSAQLIDIIGKWKEDFRLSFRGTAVYIEVVGADHIQKMNESARNNKKMRFKVDDAPEEHDDGVIAIMPPVSQELFRSSSGDSLFAQNNVPAKVFGTQLERNDDIKRLRALIMKNMKKRPQSARPKKKLDIDLPNGSAPPGCSKNGSAPGCSRNGSAPASAAAEAFGSGTLELRKFFGALVSKYDTNPSFKQEMYQLVRQLACGSLTIDTFHVNLVEMGHEPLSVNCLRSISMQLPLLRRELTQLVNNTENSMLEYIIEKENNVFDCTTDGSIASFEIPSETSEEEEDAKTPALNESYVVANPETSYADTAPPLVKPNGGIENSGATRSYNTFTFGASSTTVSNQQAYQDFATFVDRIKQKAEEGIDQLIRDFNEAVGQIKKQAMLEIAEVGARYQNTLSNEYTRMEEESFEDSDVSTFDACWTCGREANNTCANCLNARYCTVACQTVDWPKHQMKCLSTSE